MLARRTTIRHPLNGAIETPILIPSFTSKGFGFYKEGVGKKRKEYSETNVALGAAEEIIDNTMLVSAYDLHHKHFEKPEKLFKRLQLIFIDSGGYELSNVYDSTEPKQPPYKGKTFTSDDYKQILAKLSKKLPFVISNFDWETWGKPLNEQILTAQQLFNVFPEYLHSFLIKPTGKKTYLDISEIIGQVKKLRNFHIIGVTERELGRDFLERLKNIADLRMALDREKINSPIHVYGGLDPLMTPLYFFAGAEVFDGVSWLRYAYHDGLAINRDSSCILSNDTSIETSIVANWTFVVAKNLLFLQRLTTKLKRFVDGTGKTFDMFDQQEAALKRAFLTFNTHIRKGDGGA